MQVVLKTTKKQKILPKWLNSIIQQLKLIISNLTKNMKKIIIKILFKPLWLTKDITNTSP